MTAQCVSMSHVTYMNRSCLTYTWGRSPISVNHGTHMTHAYESGRSHIWTGPGRHMTKSWHIWTGPGKHMTKSWHIWTFALVPLYSCCCQSYLGTQEWVMSHIWTVEVTHMSEAGHTQECDRSHMWMSHGAHVHLNLCNYSHLFNFVAVAAYDSSERVDESCHI